jgi:hydroxysqualene synthase
MSVATVSGKSAASENFPVGSRFLPAHLRQPVMTFYAFARTIDDVADSPLIGPDEKVKQLEGFAATLRGQSEDPEFITAAQWRDSLAETGSTINHGLDLISAFKQDARQVSYDSWETLIDYCNRSAAPVGRYLLDIHGEDPAHYHLSDALCNALQVINHVQDCADDKRTLNRVYLPQQWLEQHGCKIDALDQPNTSPALRAVINHMLRATQVLMRDAEKLPRALKSRRLAAESATIVAIANKLIQRLYAQDPLATHVKLKRSALVGPALRGALMLLRP